MSIIFYGVIFKILKIEANIEEYELIWNQGLQNILDRKP